MNHFQSTCPLTDDLCHCLPLVSSVAMRAELWCHFGCHCVLFYFLFCLEISTKIESTDILWYFNRGSQGFPNSRQGDCVVNIGIPQWLGVLFWYFLFYSSGDFCLTGQEGLGGDPCFHYTLSLTQTFLGCSSSCDLKVSKALFCAPEHGEQWWWRRKVT